MVQPQIIEIGAEWTTGELKFKRNTISREASQEREETHRFTDST